MSGGDLDFQDAVRRYAAEHYRRGLEDGLRTAEKIRDYLTDTKRQAEVRWADAAIAQARKNR